MTALKQYARLETSGLWRPGPGDPGREVGVSFGEATLVLADDAGVALAHWSLPAVARLNPGERPAVFSPDEDGTETVEIEDETMTAAIEQVRLSVARGRGRGWAAPGRRGRLVALALALAAVAALALALPGALRREALAVLPPAKRTEIGATILGHIQGTAGLACRDPLGADALERLRRRTFGEDAPGQVVVLPDGPPAALALPGDIVALPRAVVEEAAEPAVVAGHILAARAAGGGEAALAAVLDTAGWWGTLRLLVTGEVDPDILAAHAEAIAGAPPARPGAAVLGPAFAAAEVPLAPYALSLDPSGAEVGDLLAADAFVGGTPPLLILDSEWVSLQGICRF